MIKIDDKVTYLSQTGNRTYNIHREPQGKKG